jgi:hypothetical protein
LRTTLTPPTAALVAASPTRFGKRGCANWQKRDLIYADRRQDPHPNQIAHAIRLTPFEFSRAVA